MVKYSENYQKWIQSIQQKNFKQFEHLLPMLSKAELATFYEGKTPLMLACSVGFLEGIKKLLCFPEVDFKLTTDDTNKISAFIFAVDGEFKETVDYLFDTLPLSMMDIQIALCHYASLNDLERVKICVAHKDINLNFQFRGDTAFTKAVTNNANDVLKYLLVQPTLIPTISDCCNNSPIIIAMLKRNDEVVELLLPYCDVTQQSYGYGTTITAAILLGYEKIAVALIEKCSPEDFKYHPLILQCAILRGSKSLVALLISKGIDVTDLNSAEYESPYERYWIDFDAMDEPFCDIGSPDETLFEDPLRLSVREGQEEITKMLLAAGAHADNLHALNVNMM